MHPNTSTSPTEVQGNRPVDSDEDITTDDSQEERRLYLPLRFRRTKSKDSWPLTYSDVVPTEWA